MFLYSNPDRAARGDVPFGILQQVQYHLSKSLPIASDYERLIGTFII